MEISVLQSLIDSTSNEIRYLEDVVQYRVYIGFTPDKKDRAKMNKTISKLAKIQKALKKEIAKEIKKAAQQRFYDSM